MKTSTEFYLYLEGKSPFNSFNICRELLHDYSISNWCSIYIHKRPTWRQCTWAVLLDTKHILSYWKETKFCIHFNISHKNGRLLQPIKLFLYGWHVHYRTLYFSVDPIEPIPAIEDKMEISGNKRTPPQKNFNIHLCSKSSMFSPDFFF